MFDKEKLSWSDRLRLCWEVFTRGKYDPRDYKTIKEQEAWERCEQMRKDLSSVERPKADVEFKSEWWG